MQELLQLPLQVQATLVAGFLGYSIYKRDYRNTEKATDMLLLVLLFGLPTSLILQYFDNSPWAFLSVFIAPVMAFVWVKWCESRWVNFLYRQDVSHKVNQGDVWKTLSSTKGVAVTQIILYHKNGKRYMCDATVDFNGEPFAPFTMDEDGIAFYVTGVFSQGDTEWQMINDVKMSADYGSMITYFPRADIEFLDMRFSRYTQ